MMSGPGRLLALIVLIACIVVIIRVLSQKRKPTGVPTPGILKDLLQKHVLFYQQLTDERKAVFEKKILDFLAKVRVTGVGATVEDIDKVFAAAAAVIPVFAFAGWEYRNIHEILLYPGSFSEGFDQQGEGRNIQGMVGNGPMQNVMVLSQADLRHGFLNTTDKENTGIHEFVHLIDKTDGATDGNPESLMPHQYSLPWLRRIHQEIALIKAGHSDINPYGATNEAEFLAVASEYFFEKPGQMEQKHPELYVLMKEAFMPGT